MQLLVFTIGFVPAVSHPTSKSCFTNYFKSCFLSWSWTSRQSVCTGCDINHETAEVRGLPIYHILIRAQYFSFLKQFKKNHPHSPFVIDSSGLLCHSSTPDQCPFLNLVSFLTCSFPHFFLIWHESRELSQIWSAHRPHRVALSETKLR